MEWVKLCVKSERTTLAAYIDELLQNRAQTQCGMWHVSESLKVKFYTFSVLCGNGVPL